MQRAFVSVAFTATFLGAFGGAVADLRWSGQGFAALVSAGLVGLAAMRVAREWVGGSEAEMGAMMAGMTGGGLGGLAGAAAAAAMAALARLAHPHTMDWSMLLMGGGMGGMLGPTIGGAARVRRAAGHRPGPRAVLWRSRRGA